MMLQFLFLSLIMAFSPGNRFADDYNSDGRIDSLTKMNEDECGNAGCPYLFKISGKNSEYDTATIFLHPLAFKVNKLKDGRNQVFYYLRENSGRGKLVRLLISEDSVAQLGKQTIYPNKKDSVLYRSLFEKNEE